MKLRCLTGPKPCMASIRIAADKANRPRTATEPYSKQKWVLLVINVYYRNMCRKGPLHVDGTLSDALHCSLQLPKGSYLSSWLRL